MKKLFAIAVGVIIVVSLLMVGYGAFLNYKSEKIIDVQMSNRKLKLEGSKVKERIILPVWEKESLRLSAGNMIDAISRLEGTVEEVFVKENDMVKKGQPICRIMNEEIQLKISQVDVSIAKAQAMLVKYEHSYDRYKRLLAYGAVSQERYDEAIANYKAAMAEVAQLKMEKQQYELQKERLLVTSPLEGEVLMLYKTQGSFTQAGNSVALIGDFSKLQFTEVVTEQELERLGPLHVPGELIFDKNDLDKVYATGYKKGNKGADQRFGVSVIAVDPSPKVAANMRTIRWEVDNTSGLLEPKRYQNVKVMAIRERQGLTIPQTALLDNKKDTVYVWKPTEGKEGKLELRNIIIGATDGKYVEIFSGLAADEIVIISGKEGLSDDINVEVEVREEAANEK